MSPEWCCAPPAPAIWTRFGRWRLAQGRAAGLLGNWRTAWSDTGCWWHWTVRRWSDQAAFQRILDEAELLNIRVAPAYRRRGVGRCLLAACRTDLEGARCLHLEVRANNWAALALYREAGFAQVGARRGYYPAVAGGREDALLLRLDLVAVT